MYLASENKVTCDIYRSSQIPVAQCTVLQCDDITHNKEGNHNPETDHYSYPVNGCYFTSVTLQGQTDKANVALKVGGAQVAIVF